MQLDIESLRTLLAVLDHGGMTRAAERLSMSQSAVSWKIKRLEERVGRPLLIHDGHTIRPTRDGRALLDDARMLVEIHDRAAHRLESTELAGNVRLGSNEEVDPERMAALLGRFKRTHPKATIEFIVDHSEQLEREVAAGEMDVVIIQVDQSRRLPTDVVLWTDRLRWVTCCGIDHDERPLPLVSFGEHCFYRQMSEPILDGAGIEHTVAFSASSISGVQAAVAAGLGVGVIGERYLGGDVVPWIGGDALPPLPEVHHVVRTVPGEPVEIATALTDAIRDEIRDPALVA